MRHAHSVKEAASTHEAAYVEQAVKPNEAALLNKDAQTKVANLVRLSRKLNETFHPN